MRSLTGAGEAQCVLGCLHGTDRIEHYAKCDRVWQFLGKPQPGGLGISTKFRSLQGFFALDRGMDDCTKVNIAVGMYAVARTVQCCKEAANLKPLPLLRMHANSVR